MYLQQCLKDTINIGEGDIILKLYDKVVRGEQGGDVNVGEGLNDVGVQELNDEQDRDELNDDGGERMNDDQVHGLNEDVGEVHDGVDIDKTNICVLNANVSYDDNEDRTQNFESAFEISFDDYDESEDYDEEQLGNLIDCKGNREGTRKKKKQKPKEDNGEK